MAGECQYIGNDGAGIKSEEIDSGSVYCTADAEVVVRLKSSMDARKTPVCREHAQWLRSDEVPVNWEQCGEKPSLLRANREGET